ncbi:rCG27869, partial [Rattus norvegicus]
MPCWSKAVSMTPVTTILTWSQHAIIDPGDCDIPRRMPEQTGEK